MSPVTLNTKNKQLLYIKLYLYTFQVCFLLKPSWKWRGRGLVRQSLNESRPKSNYVWAHILIKIGWLYTQKNDNKKWIMEIEGMERRKKEKRKTRIREGHKQGRVCMQNKRLHKFPILFNIFNNMIFCEFSVWNGKGYLDLKCSYI